VSRAFGATVDYSKVHAKTVYKLLEDATSTKHWRKTLLSTLHPRVRIDLTGKADSRSGKNYSVRRTRRSCSGKPGCGFPDAIAQRTKARPSPSHGLCVSFPQHCRDAKRATSCSMMGPSSKCQRRSKTAVLFISTSIILHIPPNSSSDSRVAQCFGF
jgi:hypothetical protein